ncbi:uncharacterized protein LOC131876893 isoform X2 [Tigriopus californicus]|uniref:uncharacterized protein LOC131876893 isoform X2 n=1 Tax=Tigriopus californicus TaxID=6832 RepID=UPI0027DA6CD5|nr:uncharacterized protein LOC131876893 isoform X2 [Tigriopus californicus]
MNLKVKNRLPYCVGNLFSAIHLSTVSNFTPKSQSKMEQQEGAPENNSDDVQEVQVPVEIVAENEDIEDLDAELAKLTPEEYEAKKQNAIEDIKQLEEDFQTWVQLRKDTIEQLKSIADYVEKVFRRAGRTKIASTGASVMAGGVTIVGGVMTIASAGAALPVLVAGASMALASGVAGGTAAVSEKVIKSKEMKKAQKTVALDMDQAKELEQALRDTRKNIVAKEIIREVLLSSGWSSFNGYQVISVMGAGLGFTSATGHAIMSVSGETLGIQEP